MANEKRLIYANAIEAKIEKNFRKLIANQNKPELAAALSYVGDLIIKAPTVDAVDVVRCKECKHFATARWGEKFCKRKQADGVYAELSNLREDDFCSYGERRTENG